MASSQFSSGRQFATLSGGLNEYVAGYAGVDSSIRSLPGRTATPGPCRQKMDDRVSVPRAPAEMVDRYGFAVALQPERSGTIDGPFASNCTVEQPKSEKV